jgi:ipoprotein LpqH
LAHDDANEATRERREVHMKRVLVAGVGMIAAAAVLVGCSNGAPNGVSTGGDASVKVEGKDLSGLDLKSVTCAKQGGNFVVASSAISGQQGLGVIMTDANPPAVQSVSMFVDGTALVVSQMGGVKSGSADVKVDGSTYTISGQAQGIDAKNPMAGQISKNFEIKVSCS